MNIMLQLSGTNLHQNVHINIYKSRNNYKFINKLF